MATRRTTKSQVPQAPLELLVSRDEAKARLQERIEKGLELKQRRVDTGEAFDILSAAPSLTFALELSIN